MFNKRALKFLPILQIITFQPRLFTTPSFRVGKRKKKKIKKNSFTSTCPANKKYARLSLLTLDMAANREVLKYARVSYRRAH